MRILFLTIGKFDNINDQGIYTDLLREFINNGHEIVVVSSNERRNNIPTKFEQNNSFKQLKVKIGNITKVNLIEKAISTMLVQVNYEKAIKKYLGNQRFDLILYSTPPITLANLIIKLKKGYNAKTYLLLKDIFPQNAVDMEMIKKNGIINRYFKGIERKLYNVSDFIGCMSPANLNYILENNTYIEPRKIEINPNTIDPRRILISNKEKILIKKKYSIPLDKTIAVYGGNLGKPQGIDYLIECLSSNLKNNDIHFVIVGSGTQYYKLEMFMSSNEPSNVTLLKQLPKQDYETLVNCCDIGLIFLDSRFTIPNFPSRILSYMQASMPIIAATDSNTDIGRVIENGGFGYWNESTNVKKFNENLKKLSVNSVRVEKGMKARQYLEDKYTVQKSYDKIISHFH